MLRFMEAAWWVDRTLMCSSSSHCVWSLLEVPGCYCWLFNKDKNGFQTRVTHAILASIYQTMMHGIKWLPKGLGVKFLGGMKGKNTYGIWREKKKAGRHKPWLVGQSQRLFLHFTLPKWEMLSKLNGWFSLESILHQESNTTLCSEPSAWFLLPVIIILLWFLSYFFPFPAESESAGCVLLHTSRKVSKNAVWSSYCSL